MRARLIVLAALVFAIVAGGVAWALNAPSVNHWLAVHTGIADMSGAYYAFWSGFGSDIAEFSLVGTALAGVYQLNRKFNCHQRGCWRIGTHPAAGGQFLLCARHHPDYQGKKPTAELIERLHRLHIEREKTIHGKLDDVKGRPRPARSDAEPGIPSGGGFGGEQETPGPVLRRIPGVALRITRV